MRTNAQAAVISEGFSSAKIPHRIRGGGDLMQQPEIRRESASAVPNTGTRAGASEAAISADARVTDQAAPQTEAVAAPIDEVEAGFLARARALSAELDHELLREAVVSPVFDRVANTLVDSFVQRAEQVYGAR